MKAIAKEVHSSILNIINKRTKAMQAGEPTGNDLLGILLESNFKEIQEHGSKKFGMSFEEVVEECKLFYFAGQETTSTLLVWTLILLAKHEDWQDRARAEITEIFGDKKPDFEGLNRLKIVSSFFIQSNIVIDNLTSHAYELFITGYYDLSRGIKTISSNSDAC